MISRRNSILIFNETKMISTLEENSFFFQFRTVVVSGRGKIIVSLKVNSSFIPAKNLVEEKIELWEFIA